MDAVHVSFSFRPKPSSYSYLFFGTTALCISTHPIIRAAQLQRFIQLTIYYNIYNTHDQVQSTSCRIDPAVAMMYLLG